MDYIELKKLMEEQEVYMTPSERSSAYNRGEKVDHIPYSMNFADFPVAEAYGYKTSEFRLNYDIKKEVIELRSDEFFYGNSYNMELGLKTIGAALGSKLIIPEHGTDYIDDHILKDYSDFSKLEIPDFYNDKYLTPMIDMMKRLREEIPDIILTTSAAGPITTAIAIRPIEMILRDTRKNPEMLHKLLDFCADCSLKWYEVLKKEVGIVGVSFNDPVSCMDILSYKQFKEFSLPHMKKLIDGSRDIMDGDAPSTHICGRTSAIWEDLADAGIAYFSVDNIEDLENIKNVVGNKIGIMGNIEPVNIMKNGSIDDVIEACKKAIIKAGDSPNGFVLSPGCDIPLGTPRENIEAYVYATREFGKGAQKGKMPDGILKYL